MTPLDDHLRTTLHRHADGLTPSPDPLGGIEARARGLRRRKAAAAVAGAALAVSAVALVVPALQGTSTKPTKQVAASAEALDPAHPWTYRGPALPADVLAGFRASWADAHPGSTLTPLFGDRYEPSAQWETVFVAGDRYGFIEGPPGAPNTVVDKPLPPESKALVLVVPGDEVSRVLVVAAPDSKAVEFSPDGVTYRRIEASCTNNAGGPALPCPGEVPIPGTGLAPFEGTTSRVRVTGADGTVVYDEPVAAPAAAGKPDNLLTWPVRGSFELMSPGSSARVAVAKAFGREGQQTDANYAPLYTGKTADGSTSYTIGQAWMTGDRQAHTFGYTLGRTNEVYLGPVTAANTSVLALLVSGTPTDLLVVVPRPGTGQVSYAPDATGAFQAVANGRSDLEGVGLIDRPHTATVDRLEVLDGDGNLDKPLYRGPVAPLLCGAKECG